MTPHSTQPTTRPQPIVLVVCLSLLLGLLAACTPAAPANTPGDVLVSNLTRNTDPTINQADLDALVSGNTAFGLDFYQAVAALPGNLFYSPYSISVALAMTYAGAAGDTAAQMAQTLHYDLPQAQLHAAFNALDLALASRSAQAEPEGPQPIQLAIANSTWAQRDFPFLSSYLDVLALNYGAGLRQVDFATQPERQRQAINQWVSDQTQEKIVDLIPPGVIDASTRLVLANAIYFKAAWLHPFEENLTGPAPFTLLNGSQVQVEMMSAYTPETYAYTETPEAILIDLPYHGQAIMRILMPVSDQFYAVEAKLNAAYLAELAASQQYRSINLSLPKFKIERNFALANVLTGLGMPAAFDASLADFSGMDGSRDLVISEVLHKAFVEVNEVGTEAAAATAVIIAETAMPVEDLTLTIDHPFIFFIMDEPTGTILFMGRVLDPSS